jgi:hypothetical protein
MAATAVKVSLSEIKPIKFVSPPKVGWYGLQLYHVDSFEFADGLPTADKHDKGSVNECAKRARFDSDKYLVVVVNHEGKATAIYSGGEKIA